MPSKMLWGPGYEPVVDCVSFNFPHMHPELRLTSSLNPYIPYSQIGLAELSLPKN